jgi:phosphoribosyl 1,2-cyclic phosphodiesterase
MYWSDGMEITVLASGSKGNATLVQTENVTVLIDAGISYLQLKKRMEKHGLNVKKIDIVLITHEHSDHIKGLDVLVRKEHPKVCLTEHTLHALPEKLLDTIKSEDYEQIQPLIGLKLGDLEVLPFSVSHDSSDAVGYVLYHQGKKVVYCTDIGYLPDRDFDLLKGANVYIFEANYDVTLLFTSARPFYLKQRIDSVKGHMSNTDSAYNMVSLVGVNTSHIVLAHPSEECNTKELALSTYKEVFEEYGKKIEDYNVLVASQDEGAKTIKI